jgi:hypothetical protein
MDRYLCGPMVFLYYNSNLNRLSYENNTAISSKREYTGMFEQPAFIYMYRHNELDLQNHVSFIEQRKINSYNYNYEVGDFVLHFAGLGGGYPGMVKYLKYRNLVEV